MYTLRRKQKSDAPAPVSASFVTPVKSNSGTTLTSTALTALHGENNPAPLLSQKGVTAITRPPLANSAVHSFDSVLFGSHGNFSAVELRSPLVLPSQQHGLPSSSYSLCSSAVSPLRPVSQLNPISVDRFQHEVRQSCTRGPRPSRWFSPRLQLQYFLEVSNREYGFCTPKPSGRRKLLAIRQARWRAPFRRGGGGGGGGGPLSHAPPPPPPPVLHVSRLGVIPKPGKYPGPV